MQTGLETVVLLKTFATLLIENVGLIHTFFMFGFDYVVACNLSVLCYYYSRSS